MVPPDHIRIRRKLSPEEQIERLIRIIDNKDMLIKQLEIEIRIANEHIRTLKRSIVVLEYKIVKQKNKELSHDR